MHLCLIQNRQLRQLIPTTSAQLTTHPLVKNSEQLLSAAIRALKRTRLLQLPTFASSLRISASPATTVYEASDVDTFFGRHRTWRMHKVIKN
jgi:hypothetical protein